MAAASTRLPADPALGAAQLLVRLGIAILAIGVPCSSVGSRRLIFSLMPVGAALVLIGAILAPSRDLTRQWRSVLLTPTSLTAIFLVGWMGLTLLWTPYAVTGSERFAKTAGTAILAAVAVAFLPTRTKTSNLYLFPIGIGAAAVATVLVAVFAAPSSGLRGIDLEGSTIERSAVGLIMLVWPALGALAVRERWASAGVLAVGVAAAAITVWTPVAMAALALGALTFALAVSRPRATAVGLSILSIILFVGAPVIALGLGFLAVRFHADPRGAFGGFPIWADLVRHEGLRLLTGHGLDTATRGISSHFLAPGTPRSLLLEVWYDLGIVGATATGILASRAFLTAAKATEPLGPFLLATLVCGLTIAISGLSTAQLWWITLVAVVGIAFGVVIRGQYRTERPRVSVADPARLSPA
jgi:hypothetical protein